MPRISKKVSASRRNGSKSENKGRVVAEKIAVLKMKFNNKDSGAERVAFEKVFRAKLPKGEKYLDEQRAEACVAAAAAIVRAAFCPGAEPAKDGGRALDNARRILTADHIVSRD